MSTRAAFRRRMGAAISFASVAGALVLASPAAALGGSGAPYTDPSVKGYLGLCNSGGQQITHGSIATKPFAWRVVSSQPAQSPYNSAGRTATLYAYQPRAGIPAGEWSGDALTASARYSNSANPMAAATTRDDSLQDFIAEFRPVWDGMLQIRMYLGAPDEPTYSLTYPAIDIAVTGSTWHAVDGGRVSCTGGKAESIETMLLPKSTFATHKHSKAKAQPNARSSSTAAAPGSSSKPTTRASARVAASSAAANRGSAGDSSHRTGLFLAAGFAVLLAAGIVLAIRRRPSTAQSARPSAQGSPKKGP
jgi:hypothetical protein